MSSCRGCNIVIRWNMQGLIFHRDKVFLCCLRSRPWSPSSCSCLAPGQERQWAHRHLGQQYPSAPMDQQGGHSGLVPAAPSGRVPGVPDEAVPNAVMPHVPGLIAWVERVEVGVAHIDKPLQRFEADSPPPTAVPMRCAFCLMSAVHHHEDPDHIGADVVEYQF
jgi:hypothetical protein